MTCLEVQPAAARGLDEPVREELRRVLEERHEALLLVGEVLVERGFRHPRLAADRLGARLGVADAREDLGRRVEQAPLLELEADGERRRVAPARDRRLGVRELGHHSAV